MWDTRKSLNSGFLQVGEVFSALRGCPLDECVGTLLMRSLNLVFHLIRSGFSVRQSFFQTTFLAEPGFASQHPWTLNFVFVSSSGPSIKEDAKRMAGTFVLYVHVFHLLDETHSVASVRTPKS